MEKNFFKFKRGHVNNGVFKEERESLILDLNQIIALEERCDENGSPICYAIYLDKQYRTGVFCVVSPETARKIAESLKFGYYLQN